MKRIILIIFVLGLVIVSVIGALRSKIVEPDAKSALLAKYENKPKNHADHAGFAELNRDFASPQEITAACIKCHNQRHKEVMRSNHWNWEKPEFVEGKGVVYVGKRNVINNYCIGSDGNEQSCAKCHIGYSTSDAGGFTDSTNIDCMICHDQTETYAKAPDMGGAPLATLDFKNIATHVGRPKRSNCGVCHFFGGGGNNVKHGDLDKAQFNPSKDLDVHMAVEGANLECVDCHKTEDHNISGKMYSLSSMNRNRVLCEDCHSAEPHDKSILNEHTLKVGCQTCHIPVYAKANATKTEWDWSTAGRLRDGQPYEEDDADGNHTYLSIKGSFKWAKNLRPEYTWFDGTARHVMCCDKVEDTTKPVVLNPLGGSYSDRNSKIVPVKVHRARQPYDPVNKLVIQPKLYSAEKGDGGFWKDFDWKRASQLGMEKLGFPFSGEVAFIRTDMNWLVNHQVAPKEKSLQCTDCHTDSPDGRLAAVGGFYMPARDANKAVDMLGNILIILTLAGVFAHGALRIASRRKDGRK